MDGVRRQVEQQYGNRCFLPRAETTSSRKHTLSDIGVGIVLMTVMEIASTTSARPNRALGAKLSREAVCADELSGTEAVLAQPD